MEAQMIAVICTDGQMKIDEIEKECVTGKWIPLLIYKTNNKKILPVFNLEDVARSFVKRNLPKNWAHGCVFLADSDIEKILKNDWEIQPFDFPRKLNENPEIQFDFEIHEFQEEPDFKCT